MDLAFNMLDGNRDEDAFTAEYNLGNGISAVLESLIDAQPFVDIRNSKLGGYTVFEIFGKMLYDGEIERVLKRNRAKLISYSSLGESVPRELWITYFKVNNDGKTDVKGISQNVEDVYIFYRNMKSSVLDSQLRLHKLSMQTNSIDDALSGSMRYEFEVTDMSDAELNPVEESADSEKANSKPDSTSEKAPAEPTKPSNSLKRVNNLEPVDIGT